MLVIRNDGKILPAEVRTTSRLDAVAILWDGTILSNDEFYILPSDEVELSDRLRLWLDGEIADLAEINDDSARELLRLIGNFRPRHMYGREESGE